MTNQRADVAIIGAGVSGLAAAWRLSQAGLRSIVFEKSRGLSGRAATRRRNGHHYDHGANFFRLDDPRIDHLLRHELSAEGLVEIPGDVHTFDSDGKISPGDANQNAVPKWIYREGISTLGKQLLAASPLAEVIRQTRITKIGIKDGQWWAEDEIGTRHGNWARLILTIPPPQCAELLRASAINSPLTDALEGFPYHPQFTFILCYDAALIPDRAFHALVNSDGNHPLAWLSFEEDKPGHIAPGCSVMIAQMSSKWTTEHYDIPPEALVTEVQQIAGHLLGQQLPHPDWWDSQRWRYAHPIPGKHPSVETLQSSEATGLYLAGDGIVGKSRIPLAVKSGIDAAERIIHSK